MTLHMLVGENDIEDGFDAAARSGGSVLWRVPKSAEPGDPAFFVFHWDQLSGAGTVATDPRPITFGKKSAYQAKLEHLKVFRRPIRLAEIQRHLPNWKWLTYPRGPTTPDAAWARELDRIVGNHIMRSGFRYQPAPASKRNVKAKRPIGTPEPKREPKLSGAQLDALIAEHTSGARLGEEGRKYLRTHLVTERKPTNRKIILELRSRQGAIICEACGMDLAKRYGPEHAAVLELHHRVPLARGARKPTGTEAFALLCPTCHRVVHYRREDPLDVEALRARLQT